MARPWRAREQRAEATGAGRTHDERDDEAGGGNLRDLINSASQLHKLHHARAHLAETRAGVREHRGRPSLGLSGRPHLGGAHGALAH